MRKGHTGQSFGFVHKPSFEDGKTLWFAIFTCRNCATELKISLNGGAGGRSPEWVTQRAQSVGWQADTRNARLARCPGCIEKGKREFMIEKPVAPKIHLPAIPPKPVFDITAIVKEIAMKKPIPNDNVTLLLDPERRYKELTFDQKRAIRIELDGSFDEKDGVYLEGATDTSIGEKLDIPWAIIKHVRERDYGVLRVPPELAPLEQRFAFLQDEFNKLAADFDPIRKKMDKLAEDMAGIEAAIKSFKGKYAA
jgi:hypothetical protein